MREGPRHLFVYGTLLPRHTPERLERATADMVPAGRGRVRGILYDLGPYPGAVVHDAAAGWIHGRILQLPEDDGVLHRLDRYEGFDPTDPRRSLFRRERCTAQLATGERIECWIYVYNRDTSNASIIPTGDFDAFDRSLGPQPTRDA